MLFSSLEFLYLYLPLTLLFYFVLPFRWRNPVLLVFSLIFYGWGEPVYVFLMIFTILIDYTAGLLIERAKTDKGRKAWLIQNCKRISFCWFKPSSLWYFVVTALGN